MLIKSYNSSNEQSAEYILNNKNSQIEDLKTSISSTPNYARPSKIN